MALELIENGDDLGTGFSIVNNNTKEQFTDLEIINGNIIITKQNGSEIVVALPIPTTGGQLISPVGTITLGSTSGSYNKISVSPIDYLFEGQRFNIGATTIYDSNGDASFDRIDALVIDTDSNVLELLIGNPQPTPIIPVLPLNKIMVGAIYVKALASATNDLYDLIYSSFASQQLELNIEQGIPITTLSSLTDVNVSSAGNDQVLTWDSAQNKWVASNKTSQTYEPSTSGNGLSMNDLKTELGGILDKDTEINLDDFNLNIKNGTEDIINFKDGIIYSMGFQTLNWKQKYGMDNLGNPSFFWGGRLMVDSSVSNSIDWENRTLSNSSGNVIASYSGDTIQMINVPINDLDVATKKYVDDKAFSTSGGGGMIYVQNGLSYSTSGILELGGILNKNTEIDLDSKTLTFSNGSIDLVATNLEITSSGDLDLTGYDTSITTNTFDISSSTLNINNSANININSNVVVSKSSNKHNISAPNINLDASSNLNLKSNLNLLMESSSGMSIKTKYDLNIESDQAGINMNSNAPINLTSNAPINLTSNAPINLKSANAPIYVDTKYCLRYQNTDSDSDMVGASNDLFIPHIKWVKDYVQEASTSGSGGSSNDYTTAGLINTQYNIKPVLADFGLANSNLAGTYSNGASGIGATLTNTVNGAWSYGYISAVGDRMLIRRQTDPKQNGIYEVVSLGSAGTPWQLRRTTDYDTGVKMQGRTFQVLNGFTSKKQTWTLSNNTTPAIGTDNITFQIAGYNNIGYGLSDNGDGGLYIDGSKLAGSYSSAMSGQYSRTIDFSALGATPSTYSVQITLTSSVGTTDSTGTLPNSHWVSNKTSTTFDINFWDYIPSGTLTLDYTIIELS